MENADQNIALENYFIYNRRRLEHGTEHFQSVEIGGSVLQKIWNSVTFFALKLADAMGFTLTMDIQRKADFLRPDEVNLNVGAGKTTIRNFESLDFYSPHYYPSRKIFDKTRVAFDMRSDPIPKQDQSVDNIYASHVIEHIEISYVRNFFLESHRVLKEGGVLRIAVPDAEFMWEVSQFENNFWHWRSGIVNSDSYQLDGDRVTQLDYFLREVATPRFENYVHSDPKLVIKSEKLSKMDFDSVKTLITVPDFREKLPGDHITPWDFNSVAKLAESTGFSKVIRSKPNASVSLSMQGAEFDKTYPNMSLYVDLVK